MEEFTTRPENYSIGLGDVCFCCFFGFTIFPLSMDTSCQTHQLSVQVTFPKQWICLKLLHDRLDQALLNFKCAMDDGEGELCETVARILPLVNMVFFFCCIAERAREIYPTKISWNLENQNSTRNPQVK